MTSWLRTLAGLLACLLLGAGCSVLNAENIPVSDGVDDPYELTVLFPDALNLARGATVKIDGASVGKVCDVTTQDFKARVCLKVDGSTELPKDTVFRLRPTTALGELFVEVIRGDAKALIKEGAVIDTDRTRSAPTVEDGLAAASLLINGGSLGQIKTIVGEVNESLEGRTGTVRDFIRGSDRLVTSLNSTTGDLDRLLTALARTSKMLNEREAKINRALELTGPVATVVRRNSTKVTGLLTKLDAMSGKVDGLVTATEGDLNLTLAQLGPVVNTLQGSKAQAKAMLLKATDLAAKLDRAIPTDYLNLMLVLRVSGDFGLPILGGGTPDSGDSGLGVPTIPGLPDIPGLPGLSRPDARDGATR